MNIECDRCHARYRLDPALFRGAREIRVRCRRCGNSWHVLNPTGVESDRVVANEPDASLAERKRSAAPATERTLPDVESARISREDGEEAKSPVGNRRKMVPASTDDRGPGIFYPPLPKSPDEVPGRTAFQWLFLIAVCAFLFLFVGGYAYLVFSPTGKGMLSGIGRTLADIVLLFRS